MNSIEINWANVEEHDLPRYQLPIEDFTSQAVFNNEKEHLFNKTWLGVAREHEVAEPGDYIVCDIPTNNASVIIVKSKDGIIRAFHNTCSHRGVALATEQKGNAAAFRCPYHGWTFSNNGDLKGIPSPDYFEHVCKEENGLTPITLDTWNGFIFVNFDDQPAESLHDFLAGYREMYDETPFGDYNHCLVLEQTVNCNWKNIIHAFNEGYHVQFAHKKTLGEQVVTKENPQVDALDIRYLGRHITNTVPRNYAWEPKGEVINFILKTALPVTVAEQNTDQAKPGISSYLGPNKGVNRVQIPNFGVEVTTLFPNSIIQILPNGFLWYLVWPISANQCKYEVRIYLKSAPTGFRDEFVEAFTVASSRDVLTEDVAMSSLQQKGYHTGGKKHQYIGKSERNLRFFNDSIADYLKP